MKVTCKATGNKIDKKTAFGIKIDSHKNNTYFTNEEVYKNWIEEENLKEDLPCLLNNILGRSKYHKTHAIFTKKLNIWYQSYSIKEVWFTLDHFKDDIKKYRSKGVPYIAQVIENKLIEGKELLDSKGKTMNKKITIDFDNNIEKEINNHKFVSSKQDFRRLYGSTKNN